MVHVVVVAIDSDLSSAFQHIMVDAHSPYNGCLDGLVAVLRIGRIVLHLLHPMETGPFCNSS
jgi:hypothetical protein